MVGKRVHVSISMSYWIDRGEIMYIPGWNKWSPTCKICSRMKRDNLCTVIRKSSLWLAAKVGLMRPANIDG